MRCFDPEHEILSYLLRHPQAQDTVEGIVDWWLLEQRMRTVKSEVLTALSALQERGFVTAAVRTDGHTVFRFNPARQDDARTWLESVSTTDSPPSHRSGLG